jgi:hypothetical protein
VTDAKHQRRRGTENGLLRAFIWWFWESHNQFPAKVTIVYSFKEYQTNRGGHYWVTEYNFWRMLWRATGMIFVWAKRGWDLAEIKMFTKSEKKPFINAM